MRVMMMARMMRTTMMTMRLVAGREGAPGMNYDAWATAQQPAIGILKKNVNCHHKYREGGIFGMAMNFDEEYNINQNRILCAIKT